MSRWYRAYEGTVSDPKLAEAAIIAGCSRSVAIAVWHAILESAASERANGEFTATSRRIAITLAEPLEVIETVLSAFGELGMVSGMTVSAWAKRQYESDNSTERSRKHREKNRQNQQCNVAATECNVAATDQSRAEQSRTEDNPDKQQLYDPAPSHAVLPLDLNDIENRCRQAAGLETDPSPGLLVIGPIADLVEAGWSMDRHILPALKSARAAGRKGRKWTYYVPIITDGAAHPPKAKPPSPSSEKPDLRKRWDYWCDQKFWHQSWGPRPSDPGSDITPAMIIAWQSSPPHPTKEIAA